jgi:hypothetical protein
LQSFWRAWTQPFKATYEAEVANASWIRIGIGLGIAALASLLSGLLPTLAFTWRAVVDMIEVPCYFFLTSLIYYGVTRMLVPRRAPGSFSHDILVQTYLLMLIEVPSRIISELADHTRDFRGPIVLAVGIYQLYLTYLAIRVAHKLKLGEAITVMVAVLVLTIIILCGLFFTGYFTTLSSLYGSFTPGATPTP